MTIRLAISTPISKLKLFDKAGFKSGHFVFIVHLTRFPLCTEALEISVHFLFSP